MRVSVCHGELKWEIPVNISHFHHGQRIVGAIESADATANASLFLKGMKSPEKSGLCGMKCSV